MIKTSNNYLFEPINLRSSINKYRNLSKHFFKSSEKIDLCNLLISTIESARLLKKQDFLIYKISSRHNLKVSVLREWIKLHQLGEDLASGYCHILTNELVIKQRELTKKRRICEEQKIRRKRMVYVTRIVKRSS